MFLVVIGKIVSVVLIADNKHLHEAQQRIGIAITDIILVINNLLHGTARTDIQSLQLNLNNGQAVNEQNDIVTLETVARVNSQLMNDLVIVFAPVFYVHQWILKRRAVLAHKRVALTQFFGSWKNIRFRDFLQQTRKLVVGQMTAVQGLELFAKIALQRITVVDVGAIDIFQVLA